MTNGRNNNSQTQEKDDLLREGRKEDESVNPFEQVSQKQDNNNTLDEEANAEQQHKEAMTERD
jgi:hypothetical protein